MEIPNFRYMVHGIERVLPFIPGHPGIIVPGILVCFLLILDEKFHVQRTVVSTK